MVTGNNHMRNTGLFPAFIDKTFENRKIAGSLTDIILRGEDSGRLVLLHNESY
jgi:hypothetical protein